MSKTPEDYAIIIMVAHFLEYFSYANAFLNTKRFKT